jgi:hypothetical protein
MQYLACLGNGIVLDGNGYYAAGCGSIKEGQREIKLKRKEGEHRKP